MSDLTEAERAAAQAAAEEALAAGSWPDYGTCRLIRRRGRWLTVTDGPSIDTYPPADTPSPTR